jgi:hypothetical protein
MRKMCVVVLVLIMVGIMGTAMQVAGEDTSDDVMCIPMGSILLEPPESVEARKAFVEFPHSKHFSLDCRACHHQWTGDSQIQNCTVSGCHDLNEMPKKGAKIDKAMAFKYYKEAFHSLCIGCHKQMKMENKKKEMSAAILKAKLPATGPTGCVECHLEE